MRSESNATPRAQHATGHGRPAPSRGVAPAASACQAMTGVLASVKWVGAAEAATAGSVGAASSQPSVSAGNSNDASDAAQARA